MLRQVCAVTLMACGVSLGRGDVGARASASVFEAGGPVAFAQTAPAAAAIGATRAPASPIQFDVVSVKPTDPNAAPLMGVQLTSDRVVVNKETLKGLICIAYNIPAWEVSGGEPWMGRDFTDPRDHFDLEAKMPTDLGPYDMRHANSEIADARIREMMQALLADRFHLKFHRETATGTVSILEQSGKPMKLVPSTQRYAKDAGGDGYSGRRGQR